MSNQNERMAALAAFQNINKVEGFDPTPLAVEYSDMNNGEKRRRLPVNVQMGWFRLVHLLGKISVTAKPVNGCFEAHARVYVHYNDPEHAFLAEATATRAPDPQKPTISPREWAQTAAIGIALRNAGFGLNFDAAGDSFDHVTPDEIGAVNYQLTPGATPAAMPLSGVPFEVGDPAPPEPGQPPADVPFGSAVPQQAAPQPAEPQLQVAPPVAQQAAAGIPAPAQAGAQPSELTYEAALMLPCPVKAYAGKTLGEVLREEPGCINWIANSYKNDLKIAAGARLICEHALDQASA